MTRRKQGRRLFGLLVVAALGVMAFASSAQAVLPVFLINKKAALHATADGVKDEGLELLLVPNSNLEIKCAEFEVLEGLVLDSKVEHAAHVKLLYKKCEAFSIKPLEPLPCHVSDVVGGKPELLHITASALLLPVEFADKTFGILATGITAIVNFLKETGCLLPLKNVISGEVCFRITAGNDTAKPLIESNQTIQEECPERELVVGKGLKKDLLAFGINDAFIDGKATLLLTGAHAGLTLGVSLL